jgi:hypothetical protein
LGLGKRIRNPSSDHHFNDNYHDGCANNYDRCANDDDHDLNYLNNFYNLNFRPWLT